MTSSASSSSAAVAVDIQSSLLLLNKILREGRTSITEMYIELKNWINYDLHIDAHSSSINSNDISLDNNNSINMTIDNNDIDNVNIDLNNINMLTNNIDENNKDCNKDSSSNINNINNNNNNEDTNHSRNSNEDSSNINANENTNNNRKESNKDSPYSINAKEDSNNNKESNEDGSNINNNEDTNNNNNNKLRLLKQNMIQQRLLILLKWLGTTMKNFKSGQVEYTSRYSYVILCGISSSFLDNYKNVKHMFQNDNNDISNELESYLYQLVKYSVSRKKESLRDKDYQQIEKYISRFERKQMFTSEKLKKWKERLQKNDSNTIATTTINITTSSNSNKSKKAKKEIEIDYEIINKYNPIMNDISDYDFFKTCDILNVLCHELKVIVDIELAAFEILSRLCLQVSVSSSEVAFAAVACLLLSSKICSTHHHHVNLKKILCAYWKLIGDLNASTEFSDQNKRKRYLALKAKDVEKPFFLSECIRFEKLALIAMAFEIEVMPPTSIGGALEKFIDASNIQPSVQQLIKSELAQPNYKFSGLCLTTESSIVLVAIYQSICIKNKDKIGFSKISELLTTLSLKKKDVDEVSDFLRMQKIILQNKYSQLDNEASIINLDAIKYKLENMDRSNDSAPNTSTNTKDNISDFNPFLVGEMDIQVRGNLEVDKIIIKKSIDLRLKETHEVRGGLLKTEVAYRHSDSKSSRERDMKIETDTYLNRSTERRRSRSRDRDRGRGRSRDRGRSRSRDKRRSRSRDRRRSRSRNRRSRSRDRDIRSRRRSRSRRKSPEQHNSKERKVDNNSNNVNSNSNSSNTNNKNKDSSSKDKDKDKANNQNNSKVDEKDSVTNRNNEKRNDSGMGSNGSNVGREKDRSNSNLQEKDRSSSMTNPSKGTVGQKRDRDSLEEDYRNTSQLSSAQSSSYRRSDASSSTKGTIDKGPIDKDLIDKVSFGKEYDRGRYNDLLIDNHMKRSSILDRLGEKIDKFPTAVD